MHIWNRDDEETVREWRLRIIYPICYCFFRLSLAKRALVSDNRDEKLFLVHSSIAITVALIKLLNTIWRKRDVIEFSL